MISAIPTFGIQKSGPDRSFTIFSKKMVNDRSGPDFFPDPDFVSHRIAFPCIG